MTLSRCLAAAASVLASGLVVAADLDAEADFARVESISDLTVARAAVKGLNSEAALEMVARSSQSWRLRADAVYFLQNECVRQEVLAADPDWRVRSSALYHTVDADLLRRIACDKSEDARVRGVAISRLRERDVLAAIAADSSDRVNVLAKRKLPPEFAEAHEAPVPEASIVDISEITVTEETVTYRGE